MSEQSMRLETGGNFYVGYEIFGKELQERLKLQFVAEAQRRDVPIELVENTNLVGIMQFKLANNVSFQDVILNSKSSGDLSSLIQASLTQALANTSECHRLSVNEMGQAEIYPSNTVYNRNPLG